MHELVSSMKLPEGEFLPIWIVFGFTLLIAFMLRMVLRTPHKAEAESLLDGLDPYLVAYLSGEEKAPINAAIANLVHNGSLKLDTKMVIFLRAGPLRAQANPVEAAVFDLVTLERGASLDQLQAGAKGLVSTMWHEPLVAAGLLLAPSDKVAAIVIPMFFGLVAPAIALFIAVSSRPLSEDRLESVLMFAVMTATFVLIIFGRPPFRSRHGDHVLNQLRIKYANPAANSLYENEIPDSIAVPLAVGLFGGTVLRHMIPLAHLENVLDPPIPG